MIRRSLAALIAATILTAGQALAPASGPGPRASTAMTAFPAAGDVAGVTAVNAALAATAPAQKIAVPVPIRFHLQNGLEVLLVERHDLPILTVQLVLRTGSMADPEEKAGLASLTADLLTKGTATRTATQIAEAMDFVGGSLEAQSDADKTLLRLSVLKKDLELGLDLFADSLMHPAFAPEELEQNRQRRLASLKSTLDDADSVLDIAANQTTYGSYPYGRLEGGTTESLARIIADDLRQFYTSYYRPDNGFLVVVGDTTQAEIRAKLDTALAGWTGKAIAFTPPVPPAPIQDRVVRLVDMDVNQSFIQLENIAIKRNHPDFFSAMLMAYILGGGSVARLYRDIRDTQGLAYGAYSYLVPRFHAGKVTLQLQTRIPSTERALSSLLAAMEKMREAGPTQEEVALAKDYYTGSFALRLESNTDLAREITNLHFYGLGDDYLARYQERIRAVTRQQIHQAARRYLDPSRYALTIVSRASEVESRLGKFGKVTRVARESLIK